MDLQKLKQVCRLSVPCRHYAKGKPRMRVLDYVSWRSREVFDNLSETLSTPYKQYVPTSEVRRCLESNPAKHMLTDVGKFYTMPEEFKKRYFALGGFPKKFNDLNTIFNESCIMIRKPALEVIEFLKRADYTKLPVKYLLYGHISSGKRITMIHILHHAGLNNFVTLYMPAAHYLHKFGRKEANLSETREGLVDLPLEGAMLLKQFQLQNESLIKKSDLKTTKEYVWNARETTPIGTPLMEFIAYGVNRVKYSCDVLDGLVNELKAAATAGRIKLLVAVGGFNSFYAGKTMIRINEKYGTTTYQISIFDSFLKLLEPNWCNGAFLTYICEVTTVPEYRGSQMPFFLLRREGFEKLDPFVPVHVPELSEMEFHSLLDYYEDRRWLQKPDGREEIEFLTSRRAGDVRDYCNPL